MLWKIPFTLPPAAATAAMATSAMSATSNAYSSRSWPSSLRANDFTKFTSCITSPLRRRPELGGDALEDPLHAATGGGDGGDRHQGDERHEQRVLEQVLALIVTRE